MKEQSKDDNVVIKSDELKGLDCEASDNKSIEHPCDAPLPPAATDGKSIGQQDDRFLWKARFVNEWCNNPSWQGSPRPIIEWLERNPMPHTKLKPH